MSNDDKNDLQQSPDAEFDEAAESVEEDTDQGKKKSRAKPLLWTLLVLAVIAAGTFGYFKFNEWLQTPDGSEAPASSRIDDLERKLRESSETLSALESQVVNNPIPDYSGEISTLKRDVDEQIQMLDSLPARMNALETSVASLAGISAGARETFLLAEAEYYLQIANAQLQLANNPQLAGLALGMADERVTQLSDPGLTAVRRAIANERAAMEVIQKPDIEGATMTLASLAGVVESLPLAGRTDDSEESDDADPEQGNVGRAWASVKDAMSGLVKVTPPNQAKLALISPDAEYFLRNNMALQLQAARLALLRGEQAIFEQTLDDTSTLLNTYFDVESEQVTGAQLTISEIRNSVFTVAMPDISESLRLLRQFRTLRETSE